MTKTVKKKKKKAEPAQPDVIYKAPSRFGGVNKFGGKTAKPVRGGFNPARFKVQHKG